MEIIATFLLNERKPHVHGGIGRVGVPEVDDFDAINASRRFILVNHRDSFSINVFRRSLAGVGLPSHTPLKRLFGFI